MNTPELQVTHDGYYIPRREVVLPEITEDYLPDNVYVHFEFGAHQHTDHFDAAAARLKEVDVFVPEAAEWTANDLSYMQRVSKSSRTNYRKLFPDSDRQTTDPFTTAIYDELQGTNKYVAFVDMNSAQFAAEAFKSVFTGLKTESLEEQMKSYYIATHAFTYEAMARDKVIVQNLGVAVTKLVVDVPRLRNKDEINVLSTYGASHLPVFEHLAKSSITANNVSAAMWSELYSSLDTSLAIEIESLIRSNIPVPIDLMKRFTVARLTITRAVLSNRSNQREVDARNNVLNAIFEEFDKGSAEATHRIAVGRGSKSDYDQLAGYEARAKSESGL